MKRIWFVLTALLLFAFNLFAQEHGGGEASGGGGEHHYYQYLFEIVAILIAAKLGGELFERLGQPAVLGELVLGMILGNLTLVGIGFMEVIQNDQMIALAAELGVILLLFEVGLESNVDELLAVGSSAAAVAVLGVIAPVLLGYGVSMWFLPEEAWYVHLFVGATLAGTSVGITARVLKDMGKMQAKESKIILGAAVVDDVLGLIILAVVSGIVRSVGAGGSAEVNVMEVGMIIGKAILFLGAAVLAGRALAGRVLQFGTRAKVGGVPIVLTVAYCFLMAGLAELIGLAAIVGAFAAGLVLDEAHYKGYNQLRERHIEELLAPISAIYVPIFFVLMGLKVDLTAFASMSVLQFAAGLSIAAIIGKQVCALGVFEKGLNKVAVGVGMIPRGEVGLIFAGIGASLAVGGKPVFSSQTFSAMVVMVMVTTLATPPLLKALMGDKAGTSKKAAVQTGD